MDTQLHTPDPHWAPPVRYSPPPADRPSRKWMWWTAAGIGLGALGVAGALVVESTALRHDLITADFDLTAEPFVTGENDLYTASLQHDSYQLSAHDVPGSPAISFGMFTRAAYNVEITVDIVAVEDPSGDATVGVACYDLPETNGHGYVFTVEPDGYHIVKTDGTESESITDTVDGAVWPIAGHTVAITCRPDITDATAVTGYVDGTEVLSVDDAEGFGRYQAGAMVFWPFDPGDSAQFDDFVARVPE